MAERKPMSAPVKKQIVILKDLGFAVAKVVINPGPYTDPSAYRVASVQFSQPPCQEEDTYSPAEGMWLAGGCFEALAELVDETRAALLAEKLKENTTTKGQQ